MARKKFVPVAEIKFGVEIECGIPHDSLHSEGWEVGGWRSGFAIPDWSGWTLKHDGSLRSTSSHRRAMVEVCSPVLSGSHGLTQVVKMVKKLKSMGATVNNSCGLHISCSHPKLFRLAAIRHLIQYTSRFEQALFAMNGSPRRQTNNYCKSIKRSYKASGYDKLASLRQIVRRYEDRYHTLNLQHVNETGSGRRVEMRVYAGTLNTVKMQAYIRVCLGLVQASIESDIPIAWDLVKTDREQAWPDGVHALRKLFHGPLHWYPSTASASTASTAWMAKARGTLFTEDQMEGSEDVQNRAQYKAMEVTCKILIKMAKKYDGARGQYVYPSVTRNYGNVF